MHQPCSLQFLVFHSLERTQPALRWKLSISLLAFTLQMLPNVSTFREIWVEDNKHCAMSQLIHSAFWRTKMPKYFNCSECARLDGRSSEWFRFESWLVTSQPSLLRHRFLSFFFSLKWNTRPRAHDLKRAALVCFQVRPNLLLQFS